MATQLLDDWAEAAGVRFMDSLLGGKITERGVTRSDLAQLVSAAQAQQSTVAPVVPEVALPPVEGDKLPVVGAKVFIHLARSDTWVLHTVVGYYVWPSLSRGGNWRVFIRVKDDDGHLNARALDDIQLTQP